MQDRRLRWVAPSEPMMLLEKLLKASWSPGLRSARPVVFDLVLERWTLDPSQSRGMVRKGAVDGAPLTIHCSPETMLRMLTERGFKAEDYEVFVAGDASALDPVIAALNAKQNVLALRASNKEI